LVGHVVAGHAGLLAGDDVGVGDISPHLQGVILDGQVVLAAAGDAGGVQGVVSVFYHPAHIHHRGHLVVDVRVLLVEFVGILHIQGAGGKVDHAHGNLVHAHVGKILHHRGHISVYNTHQDDHRRHADDDAQHGEKG